MSFYSTPGIYAGHVDVSMCSDANTSIQNEASFANSSATTFVVNREDFYSALQTAQGTAVGRIEFDHTKRQTDCLVDALARRIADIEARMYNDQRVMRTNISELEHKVIVMQMELNAALEKNAVANEKILALESKIAEQKAQELSAVCGTSAFHMSGAKISFSSPASGGWIDLGATNVTLRQEFAHPEPQAMEIETEVSDVESHDTTDWFEYVSKILSQSTAPRQPGKSVPLSKQLGIYTNKSQYYTNVAIQETPASQDEKVYIRGWGDMHI